LSRSCVLSVSHSFLSCLHLSPGNQCIFASRMQHTEDRTSTIFPCLVRNAHNPDCRLAEVLPPMQIPKWPTSCARQELPTLNHLACITYQLQTRILIRRVLCWYDYTAHGTIRRSIYVFYLLTMAWVLYTYLAHSRIPIAHLCFGVAFILDNPQQDVIEKGSGVLHTLIPSTSGEYECIRKTKRKRGMDDPTTCLVFLNTQAHKPTHKSSIFAAHWNRIRISLLYRVGLGISGQCSRYNTILSTHSGFHLST
jgi:hypothetical protein